MIYACFRFGVRLLALIVLGRRLCIEGMSNIPRGGPVLVVGNHVGNVEPPLTGESITWEQALNSQEKLVPDELSWQTPAPAVHVAMPGQTKFA